ncbi:MAG TPA: hypothetical protein VEK08_11870 [Planctomycetota bacterium]|nr:hypothetical protein [Planctomycetota bacterium]
MAKPMSWKWKLAIAALCGILFLSGFIFTPSGHKWMKDRIVNAYNELPESERRNSELADSWINLAHFRGRVCLDTETAMQMYKEFMGYDYGKAQNGEEYARQILSNKLKGMCSPDGKTGWGPAHPKAPDVFMEYIDMYQPTHSSQFIKKECASYFRLFYTWHINYSGTRKPHPLFNKYWPKLREIGARSSLEWPPDIILMPPVPDYKEPTPAP